MASKKATRVVQVIFGLALIFFGLNVFFQFMTPPEFSGEAGAFLGALFSSGYIFPIMGIVWILTGLLFLFNKCSALGAVIVFPITLHIVLFHIFLDFNGWLFSFILLILNLYLLYAHWDAYKPMCK